MMAERKNFSMLDLNFRYKVMNKIVFSLVVVLLPLIILFSCINIVTYDLNHYKKEYVKFNITEEIGISEAELLTATENLLDYIKDDREDIDFVSIIKDEEVEFFSDRDKLHMIDVKNIFQAIVIARNTAVLILITLFFLVKYNKRLNVNFGKSLIISPLIGSIPFLALVILMFIDFNKYFTIFHEIFFSNDLWLLDPEYDRLINIFPEEFFSNTALKILIYYFVIQIIIFIIGIFINMKNRIRINRREK